MKSRLVYKLVTSTEHIFRHKVGSLLRFYVTNMIFGHGISAEALVFAAAPKKTLDGLELRFLAGFPCGGQRKGLSTLSGMPLFLKIIGSLI